MMSSGATELLKSKRKQALNTQLIEAVTEGDMGKITDLLERGADANFRDYEGDTPLALAKLGGNQEIIELILAKGARDEVQKDLKKGDKETSRASTSRKQGVGKSSSKAPRKMPEQQQNDLFHGPMFQLKWLMLVILEAAAKNISFGLCTEVMQAEKFDDLVYEFNDNGKKRYWLMQCKHKKTITNKITADFLLPKDGKGDYDLVKYLQSYLTLKDADLFKNDAVHAMTICTNLNFDMKSLADKNIQVEETEGPFAFLKELFTGGKRSLKKPYKIGDSVIERLQENLQKLDGREISSEDVKIFLDRLTFAVDQPNERELSDIIEVQLTRIFNLDSINEAHTVYLRFEEMLRIWFQDKKEDIFLTEKDAKLVFKYLEDLIGIRFDVDAVDDTFTGRLAELHIIHELLKQKELIAIAQAPSVGEFGGIGQTEMVRKFANWFWLKYKANVVWIDAESVSSVKASFYRLFIKLRFDFEYVFGNEKDFHIVVKYVLEKLSFKTSLFIFENLSESLPKPLKRLFKKVFDFSRPALIITLYRRKKNRKDSKYVLPLKELIPADALELLRKKLGLGKPLEQHMNDLLSALEEKLQRLPILLQLAGAYLAETRKPSLCSLEDIINFILRFVELEEKVPDGTLPGDTVTKTTIVLLKITIERLTQTHEDHGSLAVAILKSAAYLDPNCIPATIFMDGACHTSKDINHALELLQTYSIVTIREMVADPEMRTDTKGELSCNIDEILVKIRMHRLIQQAIRLEYKDQEDEIIAKTYILLSKHYKNLGTTQIQVRAWAEKNFEKLFPYIKNSPTAIGILKAENIFECLKSVKYVPMHVQIGLVLRILADRTSIAMSSQGFGQILRGGLEIFEAEHGPEVSEVANLLQLLSDTFEHNIFNTEKLKLLGRALSILKTNYAAEHPSVIQAEESLKKFYEQLNSDLVNYYSVERKTHWVVRGNLRDHFRVFFCGKTFAKLFHFKELDFAFKLIASELRQRDNTPAKFVDLIFQLSFYETSSTEDVEALVTSSTNDCIAKGIMMFQIVGLRCVQLKDYSQAYNYQAKALQLSDHNDRECSKIYFKLQKLLGKTLDEPVDILDSYQLTLALGEFLVDSQEINKLKEWALTIPRESANESGEEQEQRLEVKTDLIEQALGISIKEYGYRHILVLGAVYALCSAYEKADENGFKKSIELLEQALGLFKEYYGSEAMSTEKSVHQNEDDTFANLEIRLFNLTRWLRACNYARKFFDFLNDNDIELSVSICQESIDENFLQNFAIKLLQEVDKKASSHLLEVQYEPLILELEEMFIFSCRNNVPMGCLGDFQELKGDDFERILSEMKPSHAPEIVYKLVAFYHYENMKQEFAKTDVELSDLELLYEFQDDDKQIDWLEGGVFNILAKYWDEDSMAEMETVVARDGLDDVLFNLRRVLGLHQTLFCWEYNLVVRAASILIRIFFSLLEDKNPSEKLERLDLPKSFLDDACFIYNKYYLQDKIMARRPNAMSLSCDILTRLVYVGDCQ